MHLTTLHPDLRKNLRNLVQGYVEHCEFSPHLTGRIDFPIYYMGFKYGAPVFTHTGPGKAGIDRPVVGMIGWNTPASQLPSQVLLEFVEILTQHPKLAQESILRMLPVANPVALELDQDAPSREDWDLLGNLADQFHEQAADGWIEVHTADVREFTLAGEVSPALYKTLEQAKERAGLRERLGVRFPDVFDLKPVRHDERWQVRLIIPSDWDDSRSIRATARFLARLVHVQARINRRQRKSARL
ncbi:hypothetical protein [Haloferula sp. BvORR071]|uniref:hypothetical protein n=1 Tax=Haloferula sp. BvORR071 TaxID=1396141 RepID=UPI0005595CA7|nr:hypothetical protein [Haloferula sp. BvORR071]